MWFLSTATKIGAMTSFPVLWRNGGTTSPGRLDLERDGLWLYGGEQNRRLRVEIPYDEIVEAERAGDRIGPYPAMRVQTRTAGTLLIASVGTFGTLSEMLEAVHCNAGGLR
jgi:hypothetical protein